MSHPPSWAGAPRTVTAMRRSAVAATTQSSPVARGYQVCTVGAIGLDVHAGTGTR
jgi:hypothetical protein